MMKEVTFSNIIGETGLFIDGDWIESKDQDVNGNVRLIQLADIGDGLFLNKSNRFLTYEKALELKCTFLKPGDLLIARMPDPIGRACIFPELNVPCVTVVDVCIVRPEKNIANAIWLKFLINSFDYRNKINKYVTGTTRQRISRGNLEKLSFLLPEITDQLKISTILSKAESLITDRKKSINVLEEFLKSTFFKMFGDVTKGENLETLDKGLQLIGGGAFKSSDFVETGIPVIKIGTVNKGFFDLSAISYLPASFNNEYSRYLVYPNELLISLTGTVGKEDYANTCFSTDDFEVYFLNQRVAKIKTNPEKLNLRFVDYLFKYPPFKTELIKANRGVRQANLSNADIYNSMVEFPKIEVQNKFAEIVEKVEVLKIQYKQSLTELENLYGSLSQLAFKGELDLSKIAVLYDEQYSATDNDRTEPKPIDWDRVSIQKKIATDIKDAKHEVATDKTKESDSSLDIDINTPIDTPFQGSYSTHTTIKTPKATINIYSESEIASFIREKFMSAEFNAAMVMDFLKNNLGILFYYFTSEELKIENHTKGKIDIKNFLFSAIKGTNQHFKIEQFFYDAYRSDLALKLTYDYEEQYRNLDSAEQTGIYFRIIE